MNISTGKSVIESLDQALNTRDISNAITYFADDAIVTVGPDPGTLYRGKDEINAWMDSFLTPNFRVDSDNFSIEGDGLRWDVKDSSDRFAALGADPVEAVARATFSGGKIKTLQIDMTDESVRKVKAGRDRELTTAKSNIDKIV